MFQDFRLPSCMRFRRALSFLDVGALAGAVDGFFPARISNSHRGRAYGRSAGRILARCKALSKFTLGSFLACLALLTAVAGAQPQASYRIDTLAGRPLLMDGGPASQAQLRTPADVAVDATGNLYLADISNHRIRKVDSTGTITTVAGTGEFGFSGDGGPATAALLGTPSGVAVDGAGNLYIADISNHRIRKVDSTGTITTVAGTGEFGFSGDGGTASQAQINRPQGVAVDGAGNLYVADTLNNRIRKVDSTGVITTIVRTGEFRDGGPLSQTQLYSPRGVAVDGAGNLYIADTLNNRIRKVDSTGAITTIVGTGESGFGGDGGPATAAKLRTPADVAVDGAGNLYITDTNNFRIRKVDSTGTITTIVGTGESGFGGDGGTAVQAALSYPRGVTVDGVGNLYIADSDNRRIRKIDSTGTITTIAGTGEFGFSGDSGPAVQAQLHSPRGVAVDGAGNLYIADSDNHRIRKVDSTGAITTVAGSEENGFGGDGGLASQAQLYSPRGVAVDGAGNLYIADSDNHRIRKVDSTGTITTIAGTGEFDFRSFSGDGGPASQAQLYSPRGVAVDGAGNLYIADSDNHRIRKVDSTGTITTIAGTGENGFSGDGGPASQARLYWPADVAVDGAGNLYIADRFNNRIRKVDAAGTIMTVAGSEYNRFGGDGGPANVDLLRAPYGVAVDSAGNLYIADTFNNRVRKVDSTGVITIIAGDGTQGFSGDGGPASQAQLYSPRGVAVDGAGNLYIADTNNDRIRKLTLLASPEPEPFSIPDRGGKSTTSSGTTETLRVGYGRIRAGAGSSPPSGIAIFQFRDREGVLISEAGVPASEPVQEGRIFAQVNGPVNTGLAIANPNDMPATIRFYFTDISGTRFSDGSFELGANQQTVKFLNEAPFNGGPSVLGTLTFTSSVPVAVVALRGFTNEAGEFLMTTLPVAPLSSTASDTVYFPHFADGNGWATQVILVNPTDRTITGTVAFLGQGSDTAAAAPVLLTLADGSRGSNFDYSIAPRSAQRFTTSKTAGGVTVGSVRATPSSGTPAPSGLVVFSLASGGKIVSEAGVPALPKGSAFRVYVEASGTPGQVGSIRSGLAITNTAATSNTVTLEVTRLDGSLAVAPKTLSLPPSGQIARFIDDIFTLPGNFAGVLRVTSTGDVAMAGLRLRINDNGELKMTTTPPSNEMDPSTSADRFFAHLADSGGWSTQFILYSGTAGQGSSGTLSFIDASGHSLDLTTTQKTGTVRVLYVAPANRAFRADYSEGIATAIVDVQSWYRRELGGLTFSLYSATPEQCHLSEAEDFYGRYSWQKVVDGVQHCAPVRGGTSTFAGVVYVDVELTCAPDGGTGEWEQGYDQLGRGRAGLTILPRGDLDGLIGEKLVYYGRCGGGPWDGPIRRALLHGSGRRWNSPFPKR